MHEMIDLVNFKEFSEQFYCFVGMLPPSPLSIILVALLVYNVSFSLCTSFYLSIWKNA